MLAVKVVNENYELVQNMFNYPCPTIYDPTEGLDTLTLCT